MKKKHILLAGILLGMPYTSFAQQITDFEEEAGQENYTTLGVYDSWDRSPFRIQPGQSRPRLEGIVKVLDNTIGDEANSTSKMLMFQRSRYASNLFGARIDLKEPFELTTTVKYVHVMIKKDRPGKVVLMGLGKRRDNAEQSPETEQFWVQSSRTLEPNVWNDAVFAIKGNGGIDIHSLVVVPDCESTHELTEDFLAYIDEIEINNSSLPRYQRGDYALNIEENAVSAKSDRYVNNIKLSSPSAGEQTLTVGSANPQKIYRPMLDKAFTAKPGETVKPTISYNGNWMNGYVYLDHGKDGKFACEVNDNGTTPEGTDLVSYYYIETVENTSGFNYKGEPVSGSNRNTMQTPEFQIPEDLEPGFYRMRFKVDWGNADAGGRVTETNGIISNGGSIVDVRLNVHADEGTVTTEFRNGDVLTANGQVLAGTKVRFGEPLTVWMKPENGFVPDGITLKHGHNLSGDSLIHGTAQYSTVEIPAYAVNSEGMLTIPGELVDGDLHIIGNFKSTTSGGETGNYEVNFDKGLTITRTDRTLNSISLRGNQGCSYTSSRMSTDPKTVFQDKTAETVKVKAGEKITPSVDYVTGGPMHGYFYIDYDNNGIFEGEVGNDHRPTATSELISYSYLNGYNSEGASKEPGEDGKAIIFPACKIPAYLADGTYRARLKIDWNNADPKGQYGESNKIDANGGYIVDFMIQVMNNVWINYNESYTPEIEGTYNAVLNRTFSQGWNTICLPFDAKAEDICTGANAQEYSSYTEAGLNFKKVEIMEAGKPYLIFCPQDVTVPVTFENVSFVANAPIAVTPEGSPFSFIGSFDPISMEGRYGVANINGRDKLVRGGASSGLYTTGSYFELQDINRVNSMLLNFDRETTGITTPDGGTSASSEGIYTLNGVLIRKDATDTQGLKKGIYIIGNQKVYIK